MRRGKVESVLTFEKMSDFVRAFTGPRPGPYPEFKYIRPTRWWQFWRYRYIGTRDYVLSRASEIIIAERAAAEMQKEFDAVKPMSEPLAEVRFLSEQEKAGQSTICDPADGKHPQEILDFVKCPGRKDCHCEPEDCDGCTILFK